MATTSTQVPSEVYAALSCSLDGAAVQRIFAGFAIASAQGVTKINLLFQSPGGTVGDGIGLYNFFKTLPIDLTLYNAGHVASVAVVAFLGAKERKISKHASFMIHRTHTTTQAANTQSIKAFADSAVLFDRNTENILREHITMPVKKWKHFDHNDLWLSAEDAVEYGIADEISEFSPPLGTKIFTL